MNTSLDSLNPIYVPPRVELFPLSEGYSALGIFIVSLLISYIAFKIQGYVKNKFKREAIKELESFKDSVSPFKVFELLKRVALSSANREDVASLSGKDLLAYFHMQDNELFIKASQNSYDKNILLTEEEKLKFYDLTLKCITKVRYVRG